MAQPAETLAPEQPAPTKAVEAAAVIPAEEDTAEFDKFFDENASDEPTKGAEDPTPEPDAVASGPEPAKEATPETPKEDPTAPQSAEPEATSEPKDIWTDATPEQKEAFDAATADAHRWRSDQGRAAADRTRITQLEVQISGIAADQPAAVDDGSKLAEVLAGDDWKTVETELPELARGRWF